MLAMRGNWAFSIEVFVFKKREKEKLGRAERGRFGVPQIKWNNILTELIGLLQGEILFVSKRLWAENIVLFKLTRAPMSL